MLFYQDMYAGNRRCRGKTHMHSSKNKHLKNMQIWPNANKYRIETHMEKEMATKKWQEKR